MKNAIRIFRHNTSKPWLEHLASDKYLSEQKYYDLYEKLLPNCEFKKMGRSEEHTSELQSRGHLVCRLLLEKKKNERKSDKENNVKEMVEDIKPRNDK